MNNFYQLKPQVASRVNKELEVFEVLEVATQDVAGTNYFVKVRYQNYQAKCRLICQPSFIFQLWWLMTVLGLLDNF